jgi:hypothetical protein
MHKIKNSKKRVPGNNVNINSKIPKKQTRVVIYARIEDFGVSPFSKRVVVIYVRITTSNFISYQLKKPFVLFTYAF